MRKFRSPDQWRQILEDQQQSGLTISEFCRQHKIYVSCFFSQRSHWLQPESMAQTGSLCG